MLDFCFLLFVSEYIGLSGIFRVKGEMAEYIESGVCDWMYLWNPIDVGYLAGYAADALMNETITGKVGDKFTAGDLGEKEIVEDGDARKSCLAIRSNLMRAILRSGKKYINL